MAYDPRSLDQPFAALKSYEWGADATVFAVPIDAAVVAAHGDAAAQAPQQDELFAVLDTLMDHLARTPGDNAASDGQDSAQKRKAAIAAVKARDNCTHTQAAARAQRENPALWSRE